MHRLPVPRLAGPAGLRLVHGQVGVLEQLDRVLAVLGRQGDAHAGRDRLGARPEPEGTAEAGPQPLGDLRRPVGVGTGQEDGELVAADPGHHVVAPDRLPQPRGHQAEQLVPVVVAEACR